MLAVSTSDTVEHDIARMGEHQVAVYNMCTDTTKHMNGIVTNMHPSEGVWIFRSEHVVREDRHGEDRAAPHEEGHDPGLMVGDGGQLEHTQRDGAVVHLLGVMRLEVHVAPPLRVGLVGAAIVE